VSSLQQPHSLPGGQNEAANTPVIDRESKDDEKHRTEKTSTDKGTNKTQTF